MHEIARSNIEINEVLNTAAEKINDGGSYFPGMTYEQGVEAGIRWVTGDSDDPPFAS